MTRILVITAVLALSTTAPHAQERRGAAGDFVWREAVASGAWLRIHNHSGRITVREGTGDRAEVRAERRAGNGAVPNVRFEVMRDGQNVTICAMPADRGSCEAEGIRSRGRSDAWRRGSVDFTVVLPRGVRILAGTGNGAVRIQNAGAEAVARTGNGEIRVSNSAGSVRANTGNGDVHVTDARGPVDARSGNGSIQVSTAAGPVNANTGNGRIEVRMLRLAAAEDMEFRTGNGRISVHLPRNFEGEVEARTGNGRFSTDFPIVTQGRVERHRVRGTIGAGGPRVRLSSGNGALELRQLD